MAAKTEPRHSGEFLLSEAEGTRSRDNIKIASGAGKVVAGAVLGKVTASGKFLPHNPGASDGTQTAIAVLLDAVDATSADAACVAITRDAEVKAAELTYHASTDTAPELAAVQASLAAVGIIVR